MEQAEKELQEKKDKDERETAARKDQAATAQVDGKTDAMSSAADQKSDASADPKKPEAKKEPDPWTWQWWVLGGIILLVVALVAWLFIRHKLFSHDIQQRYALYLSTLSYQQLRRVHGGDIDAANTDLEEHLRFIRGNPAAAQAAKPYYTDVEALPLRLKSGDDIDTFLKGDSKIV